MSLELARPFLTALIRELDCNHTNGVRATVGDLGVEYEEPIRAALVNRADDQLAKANTRIAAMEKLLREGVNLFIPYHLHHKWKADVLAALPELGTK